MKNYPLFKKNGNMPTEHNWQNTYVSSLAEHTKSLVNYSNYFLADYRRGPDFISFEQSYEDTPCFSIANLKYHQYRDTEVEGYYFLTTDWDGISDPLTCGAKRIRAGRHIINNNQKEGNLDVYKDWDNIVIEPMGYTAFYIMTFSNGQFNFVFTKNAQLYYGTDQSISPVSFYTRFFFKWGSYNNVVIDDPIIEVSAVDYTEQDPDNSGIHDRQNFTWTDVNMNPVMGFLFKKNELANHKADPADLSIGEEIIVDTQIKHSIKLDRTSSAVYTIRALGEVASGQQYYPSGTALYLL